MSTPEPDPPDDPAEHRSSPLMGPVFWVFVVLGVLCVLAGIGVTLLGPAMLSAR